MTTIITNRELTREYKNFKDRLIRGEISQIDVKQGNEGFIVMKFVKAKKHKTPFEKMLEQIEKHPIRHIERPKADLFDERV